MVIRKWDLVVIAEAESCTAALPPCPRCQPMFSLCLWLCQSSLIQIVITGSAVVQPAHCLEYHLTPFDTHTTSHHTIIILTQPSSTLYYHCYKYLRGVPLDLETRRKKLTGTQTGRDSVLLAAWWCFCCDSGIVLHIAGSEKILFAFTGLLKNALKCIGFT